MGLDREAGAFAVLYAALVVVLIAIAAIVVDIAAVREDRRADRAAADSAALGGVELLDTTTLGGAQPYQACLRAWAYLSSTLNITTPGAACGAFKTYDVVQAALSGLTYINPTAYCASPDTQVPDLQTVGSRTITISWPVPSTSSLLNPEIAPGVVSQPQNTAASPGPTNTDGYASGCDKLGVTIGHTQGFGLAGAIGYSGTTTTDHSVARVIPQKGAPKDIAALNVLQDDCETLTAKGGGQSGFVFVGPVLDDTGTAVAPGVIAVESTGNACSGPQQSVIDVTGGNRICASSTAISANTCIGDGDILDHALDPGGTNAYSGNTAQLSPTPTAEGGINSWVPVTKLYGCNALSNCQPPGTNYIRNLATTYGGSGMPSAFYSGSQAPYTDPYGHTWVDQSATLCPNRQISSVVVVPAGYNYASCTLQIAGSGAVIVQGGTLVIDGGIQNAGCLMMNVPFTPPAGWNPATGCGPVISGSGAQATTTPNPTHDAIVFIRGNSCPSSKCFDNSGVLVFPQTFVYSQASQPLNESSTQPTLWTAPDAGAYVSGTRTQLDTDCYDSVTNNANEDCVNSRFGRLTYWNEWSPSANQVTQNPNVFAGQASLNVVGVFFTPRSAFKFTGGGSYGAAAAQFWSAYLTVGGGAQLGLSPFEKFAVQSNGPKLVLIR